MPKRLTDEEIDKKIFDLVGDEYTKLSEYINSSIKFKIKHNKCNYEYEVKWGNFQVGRRCPRCFRLEKLNNEEIDKRIYELVGNEYIRLGIYVNNSTKIQVKHNLCENIYEVTWSSFQQGTRCPKCFGSEKLNNEEIDKRIFELTKNEYVRMSEYKGANIKMLVKHNFCEYIYEATWGNFQQGARCLKCSGKEKLNNEEIDKKIFELTKNEYVRIGNYVNNSTKMLIKHNLCGSEYEVQWNSFQQGNRCPKCNESKGEKEISNILQSLNIKYTTQKRFKECKYKKTLPFDFYVHNKNSKLLIEFDGRQHFEPVSAFGGEKEFKDTQLRDSIKNDFAKANKIPLLRISYLDQDNIEEILTSKLKELKII